MLIPQITLPDLISMAIWLTAIGIGAWLIYESRKDIPEYRYFIPGLLMKLCGGFLFGIVYVYYYHGGDTLAYYDGAIKLNRLFTEDPGLYFHELFSGQSLSDYYRVYNVRTGYPPIWIYREPEGFFVCKVGSLFTFLGLGSYWASNLIISTCAFFVSWKIFRLVLRYGFIRPLYAAIAVLFLPTVAFWCSGISKDAFIYIAFFYLVYVLFRWISFKESPGYPKGFIAILMLLILLSIRSFMILAIIIPLLFIVNRSLGAHITDFIPRLLVRVSVLGFSVLIIFVYFRFQQNMDTLSVESYLNELIVVQQDFTNNQTYGENRYYLGIEDYTISGLLSVIPGALAASFYRPYTWESNSAFMLLFSFEGLFFLVLTIRFFTTGRLLNKIRGILNHELLLFLFISLLMLGYVVGLSSVLFGVLVRFKAILTPMLALLLLVNYGAIPAKKSPVKA